MDAAEYSQEGTETKRNLFLFLISCSFFRIFFVLGLGQEGGVLVLFLVKTDGGCVYQKLLSEGGVWSMYCVVPVRDRN